MPIDLKTAHKDLWKWCRDQGFAGYDPYDALNSRLFQATPFKRSRAARLAWTQFHKRSPINFRSLVGIPRERNAKAISLFALAALADFRRNPTKENEIESRELLEDLIWMRLKGFRGACWGYNFGWQSRSFFAPRGTPTIVPTAFAARAFCEAAEVLSRDEYLPFARTICDFILNDLNRSEETSDEVCFSYSPLDRTRVFNASLLAGEMLASVGKLLGEQSLIDWANRAAIYVVRRQQQDGSWTYGADSHQAWSDNFHTAYILTSLSRIMETGSNDQFDTALRRGYEFWTERFFLINGWPKYFPDRLYPADIHSAAAAIVALVELRGRIPGTLMLAEQIANWTVENLRDVRGYFYYQRRRFYKVRIPYMRWSEGWMTYALARLREAVQNRER
ncbi:MAG: delta-aminolevulinic acid dehydratase [Acidobacteria bacterium]|nr:MAG: delta-aminolevulinic acid dehydratase [Acidobacteriota bacterium]